MEDVQTYAAFIFQHSSIGYKNIIGFYEQSQLLQRARVGIESLFENFLQPRNPCMVSYEMTQPYGVFASLYTMSDHGTILRGCMGKVQSKLPLFDLVYKATSQAANKDVRFSSIRQKELANTIISLSIIIDFKRFYEGDELCERDGVFLQYNDKNAISLPSIHPMLNWSYESVFTNLSDQIGLNSFLWKEHDAEIFTFESLTFQEE
jgi:uncharacterized protein (TIGR00296 family)